MARTRNAHGPSSPAWVLAMLHLAWAVVAGCSPAEYARQADQAAYRLIKEKQLLALGRPKDFSIEYRPVDPAKLPQPPGPGPTTRPASSLPAASAAAKAGPGGAGGTTTARTARRLSLPECLHIAFRNSRAFQTRKEQLYSQALTLANLRHDWSLVSGSLTSSESYQRNANGSTTWSGSGDAELSFAQRLATGGAATLAAGLDFATDFLGIRGTSFGSFLEANFTQPLWRGAWRNFAYEELYRAERDLALAVLDYDRFTQTFAVDVAAEYYRVLQKQDELDNERENLRRLEQTAKFVKAQVAGGMISRVQADQAEQNVLAARARIERTAQRYRDALDAFKLTLGLPISAAIELDRRELARLKPLPIPFDEQQAVRVALRTRPDVLRRYAQLRDAGRDVEIAADAFNPSLDLALGIVAYGKTPRKPFDVQFRRHVQTAELSFDYQLDQTDNRDAYRRAVIAHAKARRDLEEFLDRVQLEVRQAYRALVQSRNTYDIQRKSVALAKRRTKLARLEQKEGLASTRDVLEAEDALRSSKIALTSALVNYVTTRLRFLSTLGMIAVDGEGRLHERDKPFYLDRYRGDAP